VCLKDGSGCVCGVGLVQGGRASGMAGGGGARAGEGILGVWLYIGRCGVEWACGGVAVGVKDRCVVM
jgi:hypothetical protein